jgi:hypothetical protein
MTNIHDILRCLTPNVRHAVENFRDDPTERNECYTTGYLVAASEAGVLLAEHRMVLVQWVANTAHAAKQPKITTDGERSLYRWQYRITGGFEKALWDTIAAADGYNLDAIAKGFPTHIEAYRRFAHESGYWDALVKRIGGEQA